MADFKFWQERVDKTVRHSEFANLVLINRQFVLEGCAVTATGTNLQIDIAIGKVFIAGDQVDVTAGNTTIDAADPSNKRYDLIVVNSSGVINHITGTPSSTPATPSYDETLYVVLAGVIVPAAAATISSSDIENIGIQNDSLSHVRRGSSDPVSGKIGELFYNTTDSAMKFYNGSAWEEVGTGAGGGIGKYFQNFTAQTSVIVNHALADSNPIVQVYDNNGEQVTPDLIDVTDANNVLVEFNTSTTGFVVVQGGIFVGVNAFGVKRFSDSFTSQTNFTVTHNLNTTTPDVTVYNDSGVKITPTSITVLGSNSVQIVLSGSTSGDVEVQGGIQSSTPGSGTADFLPDTDDSYDIGSASFKWKDGYFTGSNIVGNTLFTPSSAPTAVQGKVYFDNTENTLKVSNDGSTFSDIGGGSFSDSFALNSSLAMLQDGAVSTSQDNLFKYSDITYTNVNTLSLVSNTSYVYQDINHGIFAGDTYDFYDGSVDGTKWTSTGGPILSEIANQYIQATFTSISSFTTTLTTELLNLKPQSGNFSGCIVKFYCSTDKGIDDVYFKITDGTNEVILDSVVGATGPTLDNTYRLEINSSTNICRVYTNSTTYIDIDISSLTGTNWQLKGEAISDTNTSTQIIRFYHIVYTDGSSISSTLSSESDTETLGNSSDKFIVNLIGTNNLTDVSLNNGVNYIDVVNKIIVDSIAGTQLKIKHTFSGSYGYVPIINNYIMFHNNN